MLIWSIGVSHPTVMAVMAIVRSQKAGPISPILCGRRSCVKPREALPLETISKIRGAGLKPVASPSERLAAQILIHEGFSDLALLSS
jgi:hypothetical protein